MTLEPLNQLSNNWYKHVLLPRMHINLSVCVCSKRWGSGMHVSFKQLQELYPLRTVEQSWGRDISQLGCLDKPSNDRFGLPNCEEFQRSAYRKQVDVVCEEVTKISRGQEILIEVMNCLLIGCWPLDDDRIASNSLLIACF